MNSPAANASSLFSRSAAVLSIHRAASQVSSFISWHDINPVVCVNVTEGLASESARSLFGNPTLAYYGSVFWAPLLLWHFRCLLGSNNLGQQHCMTPGAEAALSPTETHVKEICHLMKHYKAPVCANVHVGNAARCLVNHCIIDDIIDKCR